MDDASWDELDGLQLSLTPRERAIEALRDRLYTAISEGDDETVRRILAEDPGIVKEDATVGPGLLESAVEQGRVGAVAALLETGVTTRYINESGGTSLMAAAWSGRLEIARMLLDAGADPDVLQRFTPGLHARIILSGEAFEGEGPGHSGGHRHAPLFVGSSRADRGRRR